MWRPGPVQDDVAEDVSTPFRIAIPNGHSGFTLKVPSHYVKDEPPRRFYFSHLEVIPDFYSMEAEKLELDADPVMDTMVERDVQVKIHYKDPKGAYGLGYEHNAHAWNTLNLIKQINKHFETQKPNFAHTTPFFIDWIDKVLEENQTSKDYVPMQTLVYYNEEYDEAKHLNALPDSVRNVDGANNFLPPVSSAMKKMGSLFEERIRLRFWMAPFTVAVFSNINLFTNGLGFKYDDFGSKVSRQYHVVNDSAYWKIAVAEVAPKLELAVNPFRLSMRAAESTNLSRIKHVSLVYRDWLNNTKVATTLQEAFKQSSRSFNVIFSLGYNTTTKTFAITFPEASSAVEVSILCDPEFSHRLGFGYGTLIVKGMEAKPQKERHSVKEAHLSALSVVYDTGPIICQLDNVSSNTTSGLTDKTVASLYPHRSGTLKMPRVYWECASQLRNASSAFSVQINRHSTGAFYPISFRLKRIYDDGSFADFKWTCDAFVHGSLQGTVSRV
jgi:hypothetical protein